MYVDIYTKLCILDQSNSIVVKAFALHAVIPGLITGIHMVS